MTPGGPTAGEGLVGRDRELALLDELLDQLTSGARVVVLAGEPGIGKTVLLEHLAERGVARGAVVLQGHGTELEQEAPFGVFVDALDDYLAANRTMVEATLPEAERSELAAVFPALRSSAEPSATAGPEGRVAAYRAVGVLLDRLAARGPMVVVLDDLHWADRGTLELLSHLLRHPPNGPVLLAGGFRPAQLDEGFAGDLAAADQDRLTHVSVAPLAREAAEHLMADVAGDHEALFATSGGNPFFLHHLVRDARAGRPAAAGDLGHDAPEAVRLAVQRELAALPDDARAFVEAAAVAGDPFDLDLVQVTAALGDAEVFDALDELAARDLVRPTPVPRQFGFRHPLVRAAVYAAATPGTRLRAHDACAAELARRGAPATRRAHHVEHSAKHGDEEAVALLAEASRAAAGRAPGSAARWAQHALRLLPAAAPDEQRLGLLLSLPQLLVAIGDVGGARDTAREALGLVGPDQPELATTLTAACAGLEQVTGEVDRAERRLLDAVDDLSDDVTPHGVVLLTAVTIAHGYRRDLAAMVTWGDRAAVASRSLGDPGLRAAAVSLAALAHAFSGSTTAALEACDEAAELVDAMDDRELVPRLDAIGNLAGAELYLDLHAASAAHAARGVAVGVESGRLPLAPTLVPGFASAALVMGRLADAREVLDDAIERSRVGRSTGSLAWALLSLALVEAAAGDLHGARRAGDEALALAASVDESVLLTYARHGLATARFEAGDPTGALEALAARGRVGADLPASWRVWALDLEVQCLLATGAADAARAAAADAVVAADAIGLPMARSWARRASARVSLAAGDATAAADLAEEAHTLARSTGADLEAARALALAGQAHAEAGATATAVDALRSAAEVFERCGARQWREQAARELGRLGARAHRRTAAGPDERGYGALTGRELEVARLVVDRRTNAEIADALYLSTKTVETHLRNIFRKLDVSSRTEVARAVEAAEAD